ncbi:hypothetical protein LAZ67_7002012, partial [Cordylochernes scorpioides]
MPGHRKRRQFKQTDAFTRGMVIGLKRAGWSIRQIAADTHLGASTVHRLWRRWLEQGNVAIYRNVGATRVTSARVDRRILRQAVAAPQATCTAILQHVQDTLDHSISTRTISCRLVANRLHSCRPLRRLPLTPPNRRQGLEWCQARSTWMTEWHRVVFSDESRFCLSSDSRRVRVWRRRGERSNPAAIVERPTVRQRGIMVWGAIAYDSRSPLLRIQGTMTAQRYVDDVLRPVTLPYLQGVPNALYQQDNARPHTARMATMQEDTTDRYVQTHPPQCTTSRADRKIVRMAVTDRSDTSRTVEQHIQSVTHHPVSAHTIQRRLQQSEWNEIVFTDESRFCLQHHDGRVRVWRHRGEKMLNSCVMHRHTGPTPGIIVWGGIGYHSRTPLVCIAGILNSQRYNSEVLEPVVFPYLQGLPTAIFQHNDVRPHVARIVHRFFVNRQIEFIPWPARSPDHSPIRNMWPMVAQRLTQITSPAATPDQPWQRMEAVWSVIPQLYIQSLFESMPRRVAE